MGCTGPSRARSRRSRAALLAGVSSIAFACAVLPVGVAPGWLPVPRTAAAESCCFRAGTRIRMADGSQRPIETLRPGDLVQGRHGRANRVLALERTRLGRRRLWSINGSRPFVTAEHPFLAEDGWRAIDPEAGAREAPGLAIAPLRRGDRLVRLHVPAALRVVGDDAPAFQPEPVERLETVRVLLAITGDPELPVYNLRLDGDHTYVAEGWVVHNKGGGETSGEPGDGPGAADPGAGRDSDRAGGHTGGDGDRGDGGAGGGHGAGGSSAEGPSGSADGPSGSGAGGAGSAEAGAGAGSGPSGTGSGSSGAGPSGSGGGSVGAGSGPSADMPSRSESAAPSSAPSGAPASGTGATTAPAGRAEPSPPSPSASPTAAPSTVPAADAPRSPAAQGRAAPAATANQARTTASPPDNRTRTRSERGRVEDVVRSFGRPLPADLARALEPAGPDLAPEEEKALIERGWR